MIVDHKDYSKKWKDSILTIFKNKISSCCLWLKKLNIWISLSTLSNVKNNFCMTLFTNDLLTFNICSIHWILTYKIESRHSLIFWRFNLSFACLLLVLTNSILVIHKIVQTKVLEHELQNIWCCFLGSFHWLCEKLWNAILISTHSPKFKFSNLFLPCNWIATFLVVALKWLLIGIYPYQHDFL